MQIDPQDHLLTGNGIRFRESPNTSGRFGAAGLPDTIVLHYTAGRSAESSIATLTDPAHKASAHVVVAQDGTITQLVRFNCVAWHAGRSSYRGRTGLNKYSLGIEIDNPGRLTKAGSTYRSWFGTSYPDESVVEATHRNEKGPAYWHCYPEAQIAAVYDLCALLVERYGIATIVGHEEIAPGRKFDPGPAFPLDALREHLLTEDRAENDGVDLPSPTMAGLVTPASLNIRSAPTIAASTVAPPLRRGTVLRITAESQGWYQVAVETKGWVKREYVKT